MRAERARGKRVPILDKKPELTEWQALAWTAYNQLIRGSRPTDRVTPSDVLAWAEIHDVPATVRPALYDSVSRLDSAFKIRRREHGQRDASQ